ncbi:MAG: sulfatase-like hydrolase/transferase [Opitutales bacterium]|jgi:arylsulfatase A-like enzyme|nr:sulfatase-like hydrolase/transferase [Opitutales bacterium]MDP4658029.1 sulfatase-like hydrolase/transferase [Opitutales bacterium]MDP4776146.1 sulfatase-like hydrolase/transferase [Opitutales bacterium]MDP4895483.1 sulfatase-like hydrolase/transferase [Opitutales bacterium]MDP5013494.1 sulfatase-like hydrolase/transferase [Opitutales bacterium]
MLRRLLALLLASLAAHAADKPNIILIYSDDHGWADLGIQGSDQDIRTPHLDAMARDGVRFTRGYVSAPQCVPSRAGVLTGRYQQRFGVEDNNKGPLPLAELTIAERLKAAGYVTGQVGKWHLDLVGGKKGEKGLRMSKEHMPHAQGFDEYFRGELRQFYASHDLQGKPYADAPHLVADNRFRVVVQTEAALSFLDRRAAQPAQPFFLYLAYYAPHVPLESPEPWFSKTPAHLPKERRQALAMMAAMDEGIGQLRAKLKATGQDQNTLIFFIGDNGAPLGKAWDGSLNTPLIGQKGMLSEGGIRTPFVAAWPARLPAGKVYDQPVSSLDVAATAVAAAGLPKAPALDGTDLAPFAAGQNTGAPHERLFWRWGSQAAVLEHPWKLVRLGDREEMLFDVTQPDGENLAKNQAKARPEIVARLRTALKAWSDTLAPPGLPTSLDPHHEGMFAEHGVIPISSAAPRKNEPAGAIQGWFARNGTIATQDGGLLVAADPKAAKNARPFLAKTGLALKGPVTAVIKADAKLATQGSLSWRTKDQPDFLPANLVRFEIPAGSSEQTIALPVDGQAIHVRFNLGDQTEGLRLRSIELRPAKGAADVTAFGK